MLKKIGLVLVVIIVALLLFAATKPATFRVERTATIKAPPDSVFAYLNDFHRWSDWSPWEKLDPAMKRTYGSTSTGPGATYAWDGSSKVGAGQMEILKSVPASQLLVKLDFLKPMQGHDTAEFKLTPKNDSTTVTWAMYGPNSFMGKFMSIFFNMDKMIGKDFETGLANLKQRAEH